MKKIFSILLISVLLITIIIPFSVGAENTYTLKGKWKFKDNLEFNQNSFYQNIQYYVYDENGQKQVKGNNDIWLTIYINKSTSAYLDINPHTMGYFIPATTQTVYKSNSGWVDTDLVKNHNGYIEFTEEQTVSAKFYDWFLINAIPLTIFPWEEPPETEPPVTEPEEPPIIDTPTSCNGLYCSIADVNVDDICDTCGLPIRMMSQPMQTPQPYLEYYEWVKYKVYQESTDTFQQWFTLIQSDKPMQLVSNSTWDRNQVLNHGVLKFRFEGEGTILGKNFIYNDANQYEQVTTFENGTTLFGVQGAFSDPTFQATFDIYYEESPLDKEGDFFFQAFIGPPAPDTGGDGESSGDDTVSGWGDDDIDSLWDFFNSIGDWFKNVWEAIKGLPASIAKTMLEGIANIFVPDVEVIESKFDNMLIEIGKTFNIDVGTLQSLVEGITEKPVEDEKGEYYIYGVGTLNLTFLDTKYLKQGVEFFRPLIRGFIVFLLLLYNYKMILTFIGQDPSIAHNAQKEYQEWKEKGDKS